MRPRETHFVAPVGTDLAQLVQWYSARAQADGWVKVSPLGSALTAGEGGVGFAKDNQRFALVWIGGKAGEATPVTVIRIAPQG
jgi:hypothetical protein